MRCFLHISEFGFEGYRYLPGLAAISDDLVLWAPAALQAKKAKDAGASLVGPEEILGLVESGKVRIVGRDHYLMEKNSRKNGWPLAKWTDAFDGEIANIAERDLTLPVERRRVFFAGPEQGEEWAREELARRGPKVDRVEELIMAGHALDPEKSELLPGLVEKLRRLGSQDEQLRLALRDIRNHTLAAEEVAADVSVEPLAFREIVSDLSNTEAKAPIATPVPTLEGVRELLEMVMSVAPLNNINDLHQLLALKEIPAVRLQIESLLRFNPQPKERIEEELEAAGELADWLGALWNPEPLKGAFLLDIIAVTLALLGEPVLAATSPLTRLGCYTAQAAKRYGNYEDELDEPIPYAGMSLPFILAFGDETVTFNRIGTLRRRLEEGHRRGLI
jgi:hypothetical protein